MTGKNGVIAGLSSCPFKIHFYCEANRAMSISTGCTELTTLNRHDTWKGEALSLLENGNCVIGRLRLCKCSVIIFAQFSKGRKKGRAMSLCPSLL